MTVFLSMLKYHTLRYIIFHVNFTKLKCCVRATKLIRWILQRRITSSPRTPGSSVAQLHPMAILVTMTVSGRPVTGWLTDKRKSVVSCLHVLPAPPHLWTEHDPEQTISLISTTRLPRGWSCSIVLFSTLNGHKVSGCSPNAVSSLLMETMLNWTSSTNSSCWIPRRRVVSVGDFSTEP